MKTIHMRVLLIFSITVVLVSCLTGCNSDTLTDKSLRKMLEQNEEFATTDISSVTITAMEDLDYTDYDKFVLMNGKLTNATDDMYYPIFVNTQEKKVLSVYFEAPLSMIMPYIIYNESEETNIAIFNEMAECIKTYGVDFLSTEENAIYFINYITVNKNIIGTRTVRKIIADQFLNSSGKSSDEFEVFFEKGTAIPKYYAVKSSERVYRWDAINIPESIYPYWSRNNRDSEIILEGMYGPAYGLETVWKVVDIQNSKELSGSYNSIEDIKEKFDVDDQETNSTEVADNVVFQIKSTKESGAELQNMVKAIIKSRLDLQGQTEAQIDLIETDKIQVKFPTPVEIEVGVLAEHPSLEFENYQGKVLLTQEDIKGVQSKDGTAQNMGYYIELEFTAEGKQKFAEATAEVSKVAEPNNYINIMLDGNVISAPKVTETVDSNSCIISGDFSQESAEKLEQIIQGSLTDYSIEVVKK